MTTNYLKGAKKMKLILASTSKQRQDIFKMIGLKYEVMKSLVKEDSKATEPNEYVKELSMNKANSVASQIKEKALIVAADTVIYMDGKIYEKPTSKEEAFQNLKGSFPSQYPNFLATSNTFSEAI